MTPRTSPARVLLVDNHDSYTGSIEQLLWQATGARPHLVQSDAVDLGALDRYTHIVLGPGPGTPHRASDAGRGLEILRRATVPVLGVCFGFQEMAVALAGRVDPADRPAHGVIETITHDGSALFDGVPAQFEAVRYHSLVVAEPAPFRVTARASDGSPMAGEAADRGWCGVQFHPESIGSAHGRRLIENFLALGSAKGDRAGIDATKLGDLTKRGPIPADDPKYVRSPSFVASAGETWRVWSEQTPLEVDAESLFAELYGDAPTAVWLDSAQQAYDMGRYSILGAPDAPRDHVLTYRATDTQVTIDGEPVGDDLWRELDVRIGAHAVDPAPGLPFVGGYVGSVGYGTKAIGRVRDAGEPDAQLVHLSRFLVIDHVENTLHVVAGGLDGDASEARRWIAETGERIRGMGRRASGANPVTAHMVETRPAAASVTPAQYRRDLADVRTWLVAGDSYEACYTYRVHFPFDGDALDVYRTLRRANPAPYAAYLRLPGREILSCSPERYLAVAPDGRAETKPIKGTARRHADPKRDADVARALAADPKTRAENLMIVDLLRNDLGRISAPGSVEVPALMAVESYATVHQLVTSVRSRVLTSGVMAAEALFPPGSMTGAPKRRTVEMLDELEAEPRGAYAGVLGFFSYGGSVDLSVVIRTAVVAGGEVTVGTGGAITIDSDPDDEFDETLAKTAAVLAAFGRSHPAAAS
ncbi:aminodeoxychorismate synthase, component I [Microbacterium faecale]|uniref:aminodeoxychorismate synthase n=1 Tax=Microbacterium faecale TaxID=1804630 RepID=A0A916Y0S0_9MICO|nr:chorismate-binding protein [Microbacterium faecale]GGD25886.1 aminodeoxychorismate synthase, component I [Microbacterium faecale]